MEFTTGCHAPPQGVEEPDDIAEDEDDAGHTVGEVLEKVLNARTAAEAAEPLEVNSQFDAHGYESEDESAPLPSNKRPRFSSQYYP